MDLRLEINSARRLAAFAAVLHLAVLAGRVPRRSMSGADLPRLAWSAGNAEAAGAEAESGSESSNPHHTFSAGRLALNSGVAVLVLACWLTIIRSNGILGR